MGTDTLTFLAGGGETGERIRRMDWSDTPLGHPSGWPEVLKLALSLALNSSFPKCIVWGDGLITLHNDAFIPILGRNKADALGKSFAEVWHEAWPEIEPILNRAFLGEATFMENFPLVIDRNGGSEQAYFTFCYSPIRDETGAVCGIIDTVMETTRTVMAEQAADLVNRELAHRMKNLLAVISAIVKQSFRSGGSRDELKAVITGRIGAMAEAQNLLSRGSGSQCDIRDVVTGTLRPFRSGMGQISVSGPAVTLSSQQSLGLALALHELATNAVKYGALSSPGGRLQVGWSMDEDPAGQFSFNWTETTPHPVSSPQRRGFGTQIIENILPGDFRGDVSVLFDPGGVRLRLTSPLRHLGGGDRDG